jgi:DNA (cytosine-5)-methyltransferase 1
VSSPTKRERTVVSLFTGAGGLDLGLEAAGFSTRLCIELDADARETLRLNRPRWPLASPGDVYELTPAQVLKQANLRPREATLLVGGPPCQPFSKSSYWVTGDAPRLADPRAGTLDAYLNLVDVVLPEVLILENVKGFAYRGKDEGHRLLLDGIARINKQRGVSYSAETFHLNAAEYGVPQMRERVFVIACRDGHAVSRPPPTHAPQDSLGAHAGLEPYRTAWDAIGDLDVNSWPAALALKGRWAELLPSIPEGENYQWHTRRGGGRQLFPLRSKFWSFLLKLAKGRPSWTIQAAPGPATGPFHWKNRTLSGKELCRLQTFQDSYEISGDYRAVHRQVGNAVPPAIGELLGKWIRRKVLGEKVSMTLDLIPSRRNDCPPREPVGPVHPKYMALEGDHEDHPGTGKGPRALGRATAHAVEHAAVAGRHKSKSPLLPR